jgi:membrane-bound inhibitor of C-type lysozyme
MSVRQLGHQTQRSQNPRLQFDLRTRRGDANLKSITVTLPKAYQVDQRHLFNICSRSQLEAERCRGRQPMGNVSVKTPLLDEPLTGPAFAVSGYGRLPHLVFILDGQVTVMPQAESASDRTGRLRTIVPVIPDAPIGHFRLTLLGGKKGYLSNTKDLCHSPGSIQVEYTAQSGKRLKQAVQAQTPCGPKR